MKLLTEELRKKLPPLGEQDGQGKDAMVHVKFFTPDGQWSWYASEGEPVHASSSQTHNDPDTEVDFEFFGLVDGQYVELGYFRLKELESVRGPLGLPIERDLHWTPKTLRQVRAEEPIRGISTH